MPNYYIEVAGEVSDAVHSRLPTLLAEPLPDATLLYGELPDQAALLGALATLDMLGFAIRAAGVATARRRSSDPMMDDLR